MASQLAFGHLEVSDYRQRNLCLKNARPERYQKPLAELRSRPGASMLRIYVLLIFSSRKKMVTEYQGGYMTVAKGFDLKIAFK
jgi:hypothetical protein